MVEKINWTLNVQVVDGPKVPDADTFEVEAYDMIEVEIPDKDTSGGKAIVDVQPSDTGVRFLLMTAGDYSNLTYEVDSGSANTLDAPLLLMGEGAVKLLGATQKQFEFTNKGTKAVTVKILVGRDAVV